MVENKENMDENDMRDTGDVSHLSREELVARIRAAFGSRPDLPPGEEYVRQIRKIWAGLLDRRKD